MKDSVQKQTADSYDSVASDYAEKFQHELSYKPFDRKMLDLLIERVGDNGRICDIGCGPAQIATYLQQSGADVCAIDLSSEMVTIAKKLNPKLDVQKGDMLNLSKIANDTFGGLCAFYSIIHIPPPQLLNVLKEFYRILKPNSYLLLTFHIGTDMIHLDTWFEKSVNVDFYFSSVLSMKENLQAVGFELDEIIERHPYPEEGQTYRAYLFAHKI